jgi:sugar phosphate isomerase/epimerase
MQAASPSPSPMRLAISEASSFSWSLEQELACYAALGVEALAVFPSKVAEIGWREAKRQIERSGLQVSAYGVCGFFSLHEPERLPGEIAAVRDHLAIAGELGAETLTLLSGSGRGRPYRDSEAAFRGVVEQLVPDAERAGVAMVFEPTGAMRSDLSFVHTLRDALDLADAIDSPWFKICFEINNAWVERFLYEDIAQRTSRIGLVQLSDFAEGTVTTPARVPLGDGAIPLDRILDAFAAAGYAGWYEIEQVGPEIERLGYEESLRRSVTFLAPRRPKP